MKFWENGVVLTALTLATLFLAADLLRAKFKPLGRLGLPSAIVAGVLGLGLGPSGLDLLPLNRDALEQVVYHGLALIFIALSLQPPAQGRRGPGAAAMGVGVAFMIALQGALGLALILGVGFTSEHLHPGFGLILPMGFEQGPGQALSMGAAWEEGGMTNGGQVGLIVAALGFGWAALGGVPLVAWLKGTGRLAERRGEGGSNERAVPTPTLPPGAPDLLTRQALMVGGVYLVTWAFIAALASALSGMPGIAAMAWGFHFIFGALFAMLARIGLGRAGAGEVLHAPTLARLSGFAVDAVTCAALAAIQIEALQGSWGLILLVTTVGALVTIAATLLIAPRIFPEDTWEHAVVWYGMSTGTLPMGLALLRVTDPELESSAPISAVLGSAISVPMVAPILLGIVPFVVHGWGEGYPTSGFIGVGLLLAACAVLSGIWWFVARRGQAA